MWHNIDYHSFITTVLSSYIADTYAELNTATLRDMVLLCLKRIFGTYTDGLQHGIAIFAASTIDD